MKITPPSISVIIPAFNEEQNLGGAVLTTQEALGKITSIYEIIIIDDASWDKTYEVAQKLALQDKNIRLIRNDKNRGFGYNFKEGVKLAQYDYIGMVPGDNEIEPYSIKEIFSYIGKADIVIPYTVNFNIRPLLRHIVSRVFTHLVNFLFALNLKYFNGPVVYRKDIIKNIPINTDSFAFQAEALVKILKRKQIKYVEVGMYLKKRNYGSSKAFRRKNILGVIKTLIRLLLEFNFNL